jgi:hypothetical protein
MTDLTNKDARLTNKDARLQIYWQGKVSPKYSMVDFMTDIDSTLILRWNTDKYLEINKRTAP